MKNTWTRRRFLTVVGASAAAGLASAPARGAARGLGRGERATLGVAADELIPAADGMPSASEAGAVRYVEALASRDADIARTVRGALRAVERAARDGHRRAFARLSPARRATVLAAVEHEKPDVFVPLRNLVYEGYYTQATVQKRLGFFFAPDDGPTPPPPAFDERVVARVRRSPRLYRETR